MPETTEWLTAERAKDWRDLSLSTARAGDVTREIADDPASITVMRGQSDLSAQTVRLLQPSGRAREGGTAGGEEATADLIVLGESDLDLQRGDRFYHSSQLYEVMYVNPSLTGRVEAQARQVQ
jgi:hypothetical protein